MFNTISFDTHKAISVKTHLEVSACASGYEEPRVKPFCETSSLELNSSEARSHLSCKMPVSHQMSLECHFLHFLYFGLSFETTAPCCDIHSNACSPSRPLFPPKTLSDVRS